MLGRAKRLEHWLCQAATRVISFRLGTYVDFCKCCPDEEDNKAVFDDLSCLPQHKRRKLELLGRSYKQVELVRALTRAYAVQLETKMRASPSTPPWLHILVRALEHWHVCFAD